MMKFIVFFISLFLLPHSYAQDDIELLSYIENIRGSNPVMVENIAGMKWRVKRNDTLNIGDTIITQAKTVVSIRLSDGSIIRIAPNSKFKIEKITKRSKNYSQWIFNLIKGEVRGNIRKGRRSDYKLIIKSSYSAMGIRGTEFSLGIIESTKVTILQTHSGEVVFAKKANDLFKKRNIQYVSSGQISLLQWNAQKPVRPLNISEALNSKHFMQYQNFSQRQKIARQEQPLKVGKQFRELKNKEIERLLKKQKERSKEIELRIKNNPSIKSKVIKGKQEKGVKQEKSQPRKMRDKEKTSKEKPKRSKKDSDREVKKGEENQSAEQSRKERRQGFKEGESSVEAAQQKKNSIEPKERLKDPANTEKKSEQKGKSEKKQKSKPEEKLEPKEEKSVFQKLKSIFQTQSESKSKKDAQKDDDDDDGKKSKQKNDDDDDDDDKAQVANPSEASKKKNSSQSGKVLFINPKEESGKQDNDDDDDDGGFKKSSFKKKNDSDDDDDDGDDDDDSISKKIKAENDARSKMMGKVSIKKKMEEEAKKVMQEKLEREAKKKKKKKGSSKKPKKKKSNSAR